MSVTSIHLLVGAERRCGMHGLILLSFCDPSVSLFHHTNCSLAAFPSYVTVLWGMVACWLEHKPCNMESLGSIVL